MSEYQGIEKPLTTYRYHSPFDPDLNQEPAGENPPLSPQEIALLDADAARYRDLAVCLDILADGFAGGRYVGWLEMQTAVLQLLMFHRRI